MKAARRETLLHPEHVTPSTSPRVRTCRGPRSPRWNAVRCDVFSDEALPQVQGSEQLRKG